ncbi:SiaB family protein kinase [Pseudomonas sp. DTU_2021_1001937_2_SI_NGA_ILE_001]|uniref:SiaB family protein kinase n=1 Tax=Pseudomonas sp. DTU_2021_1001937_2_SI_NGA_ILE_001 TaxID=3077589 RepID=UPI0025CD3E58|nr:SiaB family protein kinase [Pseudomonas sp. DTU_2021_1001937_2_SI_NGA_ILE_001]WNW11076.1 SiaB family protein kinase [Pseudomonas sp. DTU_2021_1001937_2_SI_NGA_ILE_001]
MTNLLCATQDHDMSFFDLAQQRNVIFYHMGYFSHSVVSAMAEVVKLQLEVSGVSGPTRRKLFSSFIELSQNIVHYSADTLGAATESETPLRQGSVCISAANDRYTMLCANPVASTEVERLRSNLEPLRGMSVEEIKQAYKVSLRAETPEGSKGAGLGFLTMARDASEPLEYSFQPRPEDPQTTLFCLKATI